MDSTEEGARWDGAIWAGTWMAPTEEQAEVMTAFVQMLESASWDGGKKRATGEKVSWKVDPDHLPAIFSHLNKYFHDELIDPDSGAHPLVHLAWRALAIAWQDTHEREGEEE